MEKGKMAKKQKEKSENVPQPVQQQPTQYVPQQSQPEPMPM